MATISINTGGASGFLYNNASGTARLCVTAEDNEFDNELLRHLQDEGFDVIYLPFDGDGKEYAARLRGVKEGLGVGENYAVIAFGDAASFCLDHYLKPTNASRLCALIAYYPTNIPDTRSRFPFTVKMLVHLAGHTVDVTTVPTALGLQGKKKRRTRQITPGIGTGERLFLGYPAYTYEYVQPGFAEHDLDEYDPLAAELAWSRTMHVLRRAFNRDLELEKKWEEHVEGRFFASNVSETMDPFSQHRTPIVTHTPTMSGGIGTQAIRNFYEQHFIRKLPPSMRLRLISRTIGADRIVEELYVTFEHTHEIPWMLPGIPPTNKKVEIILISIACMKAGKLYSEHMYWDQASVLVQVGLLDPRSVPAGPSSNGVDRLPVVGRDAARRILHENPDASLAGRGGEKEFHNRLIKRAIAKAKGKLKRGGEGGKAGDESGTEAFRSDLDTPGPSLMNGKGRGKGGKAVQKEARPINVTREMGEETETEAEGGGGSLLPRKESDLKKEDDRANGHANGKAASASAPAPASVEDDNQDDNEDDGQHVDAGADRNDDETENHDQDNEKSEGKDQD